MNTIAGYCNKRSTFQETILSLIDLVLERLNDIESGLTFRVMHDVSVRGHDLNIQIKQCEMIKMQIVKFGTDIIQLILAKKNYH